MSDHVKVQPGDNTPLDIPGDAASRRESMGLTTAMLAGPLLWFSQQQLCSVLVPWVCVHGGVGWLHGVTAACLAGTIASGGLAVRYWRRIGGKSSKAEGARSPGEQRALFMAQLGAWMSLFFALVIAAQGIPNFLLDPCQR